MKIVSSAPAWASLLHPAAFSNSGEAAGSSCSSSVAAGWEYSQQGWAVSLLPPSPRPSSCSLPGFAVSFLSPVCHPWSSGVSVLLWGPRQGLALAPCCPRMEEPLLSSASSLPLPFPSPKAAVVGTEWRWQRPHAEGQSLPQPCLCPVTCWHGDSSAGPHAGIIELHVKQICGSWW